MLSKCAAEWRPGKCSYLIDWHLLLLGLLMHTAEREGRAKDGWSELTLWIQIQFPFLHKGLSGVEYTDMDCYLQCSQSFPLLFPCYCPFSHCSVKASHSVPGADFLLWHVPLLQNWTNAIHWLHGANFNAYFIIFCSSREIVFVLF